MYLKLLKLGVMRMGYISETELKTLKFEDLYNRRIVIYRMSLSRNTGILITQWLYNNKHLILEERSNSSKSKWGRNSSTLIYTAFFKAESSYSDNYPDGCLITPLDKIPETLTAEQISQTPTIAELFLGLVKKYPNGFHNVYGKVKNDLDDIKYLEWMHPKALIKNII